MAGGRPCGAGSHQDRTRIEQTPDREGNGAAGGAMAAGARRGRTPVVGLLQGDEETRGRHCRTGCPAGRQAAEIGHRFKQAARREIETGHGKDHIGQNAEIRRVKPERFIVAGDDLQQTGLVETTPRRTMIPPSLWPCPNGPMKVEYCG